MHRARLQSCVFKVDYVVEAIGNREFGSVFLNERDNVALAVVAAGWAKVRARAPNCRTHGFILAGAPIS